MTNKTVRRWISVQTYTNLPRGYCRWVVRGRSLCDNKAGSDGSAPYRLLPGSKRHPARISTYTHNTGKGTSKILILILILY